ncbi:sensor histidine kinase [Fibrisoma limi]|nr:sensor histidine kinase [Fibrisoma limi]
MVHSNTQYTTKNLNAGEPLFDFPPRKVTWDRILLHVLFWLWDGHAAYWALDRVLRVKPDVAPDPDMFVLMYVTHVGTTMLLFYSYGYLIVPMFLRQLIILKSINRNTIWNELKRFRVVKPVSIRKLGIVLLSTLAVFAVFNVYDYYLFTYVANHFKPIPAYVKRINDLLGPMGPIGVFSDYSLLSFIWAYNVSYILLPLQIRLIREAISWGVANIRQKEQNKILVNNQLQALQHQINPHFLFNVFNSILALIHRTNRQAAELLRKLSELMHYTLYDTNKDFVPLTGELTFIQNYIDIEKSRQFNDEHITIKQRGDPDGLLVPPLLLVTFVENAFKHGINNSYEKAWVCIDIYIDASQDVLRVTIENPITDDVSPLSGGLGIANARKRLDLLFTPKQYQLNIQQENSIYQVHLVIPLKREKRYEYSAAH